MERKMVLKLQDFHTLVGQTVMYCQIIEHDVKMIFAIMCKGDVNETLNMIDEERWTLGLAINELKAIDSQGKKQYIADSDYAFLRQITKKRNYWCHSAYLKFVYDNNFLEHEEYGKICGELLADNEQLRNVYKTLEKVRITLMKELKK